LTIFVFNIFALWGYAGVGPYMLTKVKGVDVMFAGGVFTTAFGLGPLAAPWLGYTADKVGRKPLIVFLSLIVAAGMWVLFASDVVNKPILVVAAFISGVGINSIYMFGFTVVHDAAPAHYIGVATGMVGAFGYLAASISGWAIGIVTQHFGHLTAVYGVLIGSELLVALCAILWVPSRRKLLEGHA
jgi:sugar phosphate permease